MTFEQSNEGRSYLSNLRDYLPTSQQMQELGTRVANITSGAKNGAALEHAKPASPRVVLWKGFEEFEFGNQRYVFLVLGLIDGFQIFEVQSSRVCRLVAQHSDAPVSSALGAQLHSSSFSQQASSAFDAHLLNQRALASTPIGQVRFLTHPATLRRGADDAPPAAGNAPYYGTLLAVCSAEDRPNFPRSVLKIFSLAHGSYVHLLRFPRRIVGVATHPASRFLCVMLEHELHVFSTPTDCRSLDFPCLFSTRTFPNPGPHILAQLSQGNVGPGAATTNPQDRIVNLGPQAAALLSTASFAKEEAAVFAVSKRWVAYCPNEPLLPQQQQTQQSSGPSGGGFNSSPSPLMAHYAAVDPSQQEFHRSPLFQPLQERQSASSNSSGTGSSSSSSFSLGSSLGAVSGSGESLSTVVSGLASKLYNVAGQGKKLAANYLSGEDATGQNVSLLGGSGGSSGAASSQDSAAHAAASSVLGTVVVRDMQSERVIASILAHPGSQITHLAFDRSGTLLATAPVDGQYIHVYAVVVVPQPCSMASSVPTSGGVPVDMSPQMQSRRSSTVQASNSPLLSGSAAPSPSAASLPPPPLPVYQTRFLYRLFRGITHASIRCISFSLDSRYLAVLSSKGTTHLYALNPLLGGDPSPLTHGPGATVSQHENTLNQQLVAKYAVLQAQQAAMNQAGIAAASPAAQERGLVGLDVWLSQPKTLHSIYRLKPKVACAFSSSQHAPPMYTPVIACFARLAAVEQERVALLQQQQLNRQRPDDPLEASPLHHLLVVTWNEELSIYSLSTAFQSSAAKGSAPAPAHTAATAANVKLALLVSSVANFDLQPTALNNANSAGEHTPQRAQQQQQPHQQRAEEPQPTVRYLTQRGQEDEQAAVMSPRSVSTFFLSLESDRVVSPAGAPPSTHEPVSIPRSSSALSTHSPIFSSLTPRHASSPAQPVMRQVGGGSPESKAPLPSTAQQAGSWLSEVELRTYEVADVPLWASPQFILCSYERTPAQLPDGAAAAQLAIEQLGCKPLQYEKFASFAGLSTAVPQPHHQHDPQTKVPVSSSPHVLETDISQALSSSMLDDSAFRAALRGPSDGQNGGGDGNEQQQQQKSNNNGTLLAGQMQIDAEYFPRQQQPQPAAQRASLSGSASSLSPSSAAREPSTSAARSASPPTSSPPMSQSGVFFTGASDSAILDARLPPPSSAPRNTAVSGDGSNGEESILSPPPLQPLDTPEPEKQSPQHKQAEPEPEPEAAAAEGVAAAAAAPSSSTLQVPEGGGGKKKKKKKKGAQHSAADVGNSASDRDE